MPIQWYFKKDGQEHGPVTSDDIRRLASLGMLQPTDLVRKAEMARWAQASALKGLFPSPPSQVTQKPTAATPAPAPPRAAAATMPQRQRGRSAGLSKLLWSLTATSAVVVTAAFIHRMGAAQAYAQTEVRHSEPLKWQQPTTEPVLASEISDPMLLALNSQSPFDRGMALRQVRTATMPPKLRGQVHQIICDTLDNRAFESIWSHAARALGEVGTPDDLPRLVPLIQQAPVETQCAAMAAALVLNPDAGIKYFEPRAADDQYGGTTASYLADWGPRCEPAAVVMLKSSERMCRYHAIFLLKAFGTTNAIGALTRARQAEPDKLIADGYQLTIDAINSRNQ